MDITIFLVNGQSLKANVTDYNAVEFTQSLNNPQILMVNIGDIVINKHAVQMIVPSDSINAPQ
ncbi:hypothetical protein KHA94_13410 [Bacillus sp. FJAT-49705]|uniref:Uncharacterized protein n=1 Tax=Cytobacillus citreus TaxID=2833586 RepID=A0ABS5NUD1_9BACI|nr:hypothetical protein [Cytobacillus citreus]MBS4191181.1 hypothetical protein [Cytobacillus citreus]